MSTTNDPFEECRDTIERYALGQRGHDLGNARVLTDFITTTITGLLGSVPSRCSAALAVAHNASGIPELIAAVEHAIAIAEREHASRFPAVKPKRRDTK